MDTQERYSILKRFRKVAVVGISANPDRPSHWIARYLIAQGYEVVGVNPGMPEIPGIRIVPSIRDIEGPLEIVDVFRSPDAIPALVDELAPLEPAVLWLQPGAENPEAAERARKLGIPAVIEGDCIYADHQRMTTGAHSMPGS